jgi:hypothetical protein
LRGQPFSSSKPAGQWFVPLSLTPEARVQIPTMVTKSNPFLGFWFRSGGKIASLSVDPFQNRNLQDTVLVRFLNSEGLSEAN